MKLFFNATEVRPISSLPFRVGLSVDTDRTDTPGEIFPWVHAEIGMRTKKVSGRILRELSSPLLTSGAGGVSQCRLNFVGFVELGARFGFISLLLKR
jgi:hypothetical protein